MRLRHDQGSRDGLSFDPTVLHTGSNSGYQAINLAVLLGATRIILLGYDMKYGAGGQKHWHPDHEKSTNPAASQLATWVLLYKTMVPDLKQAGIEVINCSRETALDCFPRVALGDALD